MNEFLTGWYKNILDNRADKSWLPSLWAGKATAQRLVVIAGQVVEVEPTIPEGDLVLMGSGVRAEAIPAHGLRPEIPAGPYFEEKARYSGIR